MRISALATQINPKSRFKSRRGLGLIRDGTSVRDTGPRRHPPRDAPLHLCHERRDGTAVVLAARRLAAYRRRAIRRNTWRGPSQLTGVQLHLARDQYKFITDSGYVLLIWLHFYLRLQVLPEQNVATYGQLTVKVSCRNLRSVLLHVAWARAHGHVA